MLRRAGEDPGRIAAAKALVRAAVAQRELAQGAYYPTLAFDARSTVSHENRPVFPGNPPVYLDNSAVILSAGALFDLTIVDFGARRHAVRAADAGLQGAELSLAAVRQASMRVAGELFFRALMNEQLLENGQQTVRRRQEMTQAVRQLVAGNFRPDVDLQRAELEQTAAEDELRALAIQRDAGRSALAIALALPPTHQVVALDRTPLEPKADLSRGIDQALATRPELAEAEAQLQRQTAEAERARASRRPVLALQGAAQASHAEVLTGYGLPGRTYAATGALVLRWNALDATLSRRVALARTAAAVARAELQTRREQVSAEVSGAAYELDRAEAIVAQAEHLLAGSTRTEQVQRERYLHGVASLLELLDAQALEQNARARLIVEKGNLQIARIRWLSVSGTLETYAQRAQTAP